MYNILNELENKGYKLNDPWDAVTIFENKLAEYKSAIDLLDNAQTANQQPWLYNEQLIKIKEE
jgi:hypothetical protein